MQLTATGITLPNNDWKIQSFKEVKSLSRETMCFTAVLVHIPTKVKFTLENNGWGGPDSMQSWDENHTKRQAAEKAWEAFVEECRPVLKATVAHDEESVDLYDGMDFHFLQDSVINLFTEEAAYRKDLSKAHINACVRQPHHGPNEFDIYSVSPEALKKSGKVQGLYWDKKAENWVSL